jgi:hypothetical protein
MTSTAIARLKITLDDVKPAVQRRIEVPLKIRLDRLHLVFQAAMGWSNSHLYEIRAGGVGCQIASNRDPLFACNVDPLGVRALVLSVSGGGLST